MDWETPDDLFGPLNEQFNFKMDVCAVPGNRKCEIYLTPQIDALKVGWKEFYKNQCKSRGLTSVASPVFWMNPPYGRGIKDWIRKAWTESQKGCRVVCLIPARTCTTYWHQYVMRASEVRFVRGRLRFVGAKASAPFPSCVVIFEMHNQKGPTMKSMFLGTGRVLPE